MSHFNDIEMKKIYILFLSISVLPSCTSLLEEDVRSQITDNYLNTSEGLESAVNAAYSHIRHFYGSEQGGALTVFGTDEFTNGYGGSFMDFNFYNNGLNARTSLVDHLWSTMYVGINNCNAIISRADRVTDMDEAKKAIRVGEAKYLRAFYYFLLVQTFGPVHLTLEESQGVVVEASRTPVDEVYDAIIADLDYAVANLPPVADHYGRATRPAAEFLLAKVYLTRAGSEFAKTDDYQRAANLSINVIDDYNFALVDDFAKVFEEGSAEINPEVVWSVQYSDDLLTTGDGNRAHMYFLAEYDRLPGMKRDIENGRPWVRFKPTLYTIMDLFDRDADSRYEASFKFVFYCNNPGKFTIRGNTVTLELGDTAIWVADRIVTPEELEHCNYSVYDPTSYNERIYPTLTKFLDPTRVALQETRGSRDFLVFRLAEAYLNAAEALVMSGRAAEAVPYVNAVRTRAAKEGAEAAMQVTADMLDIDFLLEERSRELLGEYTRWFDLVRTGKLVERVKKYNPDGAAGIKAHHRYRPIPQTQIDRTEGGAAAFPQNSGYEN